MSIKNKFIAAFKAFILVSCSLIPLATILFAFSNDISLDALYLLSKTQYVIYLGVPIGLICSIVNAKLCGAAFDKANNNLNQLSLKCSLLICLFYIIIIAIITVSIFHNIQTIYGGSFLIKGLLLFFIIFCITVMGITIGEQLLDKKK